MWSFSNKSQEKPCGCEHRGRESHPRILPCLTALSSSASPPHWEGSASHPMESIYIYIRSPFGFGSVSLQAFRVSAPNTAKTLSGEQGRRPQPLLRASPPRAARIGSHHNIPSPPRLLAGGGAALSLCATGSRSGAVVSTNSSHPAQPIRDQDAAES